MKILLKKVLVGFPSGKRVFSICTRLGASSSDNFKGLDGTSPCIIQK